MRLPFTHPQNAIRKSWTDEEREIRRLVARLKQLQLRETLVLRAHSSRIDEECVSQPDFSELMTTA